MEDTSTNLVKCFYLLNLIVIDLSFFMMYLFYTKMNWPHGESYTLCVVFIAVLCDDLY